MGKRLHGVAPRVSLRGLIAAGPQPADSGMFNRGSAIALAADPRRRDGIEDRLATIRKRAKERQRAAKRAAARLTPDDADFLRVIGAL